MIKISRDYSKQTFDYRAQDGTLWNVNRRSGNWVHIWTVDAWGMVIHDVVDIHWFERMYQER